MDQCPEDAAPPSTWGNADTTATGITVLHNPENTNQSDEYFVSGTYEADTGALSDWSIIDPGQPVQYVTSKISNNWNGSKCIEKFFEYKPCFCESRPITEPSTHKVVTYDSCCII